MGAPFDPTGHPSLDDETHCVVTEWEDGTVTVYGPYESYRAGVDAMEHVAATIAERTRKSMDPEECGPSFRRIGSDGEDTIDVYVQVQTKYKDD